MAKRWQKADVSYLQRYGRTKPVEELAKRFKTDAKTVREKLAELAPKAVKKTLAPARLAASKHPAPKSASPKKPAPKPAAPSKPARRPAPAKAPAPKPAAKKAAAAKPVAAKPVAARPVAAKPVPKAKQSKAAPSKATAKAAPARPVAMKPVSPKNVPPKPTPAKHAAAKAAPPQPAAKPQAAKPAPPRAAAAPPAPRPAPPKPAPAKPAADLGLAAYTQALTAMHQQDWARAAKLFAGLAADDDQPELAARSRQYLLAAQQRLASEPEADGHEDAYLKAVFEKNRGNLAAALEICRRGGRDKKDERFAYMVASLYALESRAEEAAQALAQAVELNPKNRIHAYHDADFAELRKDRDFRHLFDFP